MTVLAQDTTSWAENSVPLLLLALFGIGAIVVAWQLLALWRARMTAVESEAYRTLVEQLRADQQRTADTLESLAGEMAHVRARTDELQRILKTVDQ